MGKHIKLACVAIVAVGIAAVVGTGCSSGSDDQSEELAACASSDSWWLTQYGDVPGGDCEGKVFIVDGKKVQYYTNCGPTVTAMMRKATTCGASKETAAEVRSLLNSKVGVKGCNPTGADEWTELLNDETGGKWVGDGKQYYKATNHCVAKGANANYTVEDLAHDMASGAVSVAGVEGRCSGPVDSKGNCTSGQKAPCGWAKSAGHALFIAAWNPTTKKFSVFDPDSHKDKDGKFARCGSDKKGYFKAEWTEAQLKAWSGGYDAANAGMLCVTTTQGEQKAPTPPPPPPPPPADYSDQPAHAVCGATSLHNFYNCGFESTMTNADANTLYYCNGSDGIPVANCLSGCTHSATDDYCKTPESTATFMGGSEYNYTLTSDWETGFYKGTCMRGGRGQPHQAMTGLSMDNDIGGAANKVLCEYNNATKFPGTSCNVRNFANADSRGTTTTGDWDYGYFKGECAANEYVAGVSQSVADTTLDSVLCCAGTPAHTSCSTVTVTPEDRETGSLTSDWDYGYWKGECGAGRYVAGVSTPPDAGSPHAILCCDY